MLVVVAVLVVGVLSVAGAAGGELRREAVGTLPVVDAGNYVGTEHGVALSNSGGLRVRWPRPEGFKGIWFEEEPIGRRERVVWESQRYVGKPVDIPKLKRGQVHEEFVGLPDICAPVVQERMEELGYPILKSGIWNSPLEYSCAYANIDLERPERMDTINVSLEETRGDRVDATPQVDYQNQVVVDLVSLGDHPAAACLARGYDIGGRISKYVQLVKLDAENEEVMCRMNGLYWQVFANVMGGTDGTTGIN